MDAGGDGTSTSTCTPQEREPIPMIDVGGVKFPSYYRTNRPLKEHVQCLRSLELRDDDVFLCAFPRAGTHWTWEMGSMLLSQRAEPGHRTKENCMLEGTSIEDLQRLPSPRLLNTHLPAPFLPRQVKDKQIKVIHAHRNVKDVFVSAYLFATRSGRREFKYTLEEFEMMFLSDAFPGGTYVNYMKKMDEFIRDHPEVPVFNLPYEDMIENSEESVKRLGDFLGVGTDPTLCADIAEACSIQKLQAVDNSRQRPAHLDNGPLYRKGKVGDWKNHLTVAQSERLDDVMKQLEGHHFRIRFEL